MNIFKHLPNTITCLNLLSGSIAIFYIFQNNLLMASYLVGAGLIFDYLDGMTARLTKSYSDIGAQLDSLADLVTFGLVPAFIGFAYIQNIHPNGFLKFTPFVMIAFSAIRLAKFNIDTRQSENFIGVPTPANALFWASIPLLSNSSCMSISNHIFTFLTQPYVIIVFSVILSYFLIAEIPMFSFKFKNMSWKDNSMRFTFLIFAVLLLAVIQLPALPIIIISYIITSIVLFVLGKTKIEEGKTNS